VRRRAPRPLAAALEVVLPRTEPPTLIARVQTAWPTAVGEVVAAEAEPASEREGLVTVRCSSSLWASELDLMQGDLAASLNEALGSSDASSPVSGLRFVTAS
jgi:predicted nucleic acid-binding Zn ribbon protein